MPEPPAPAHSPQHRRHGERRGSGDRGHACPAPRGEVMGSGSAVDRFHTCSPAVCVEGLWVGSTRVPCLRGGGAADRSHACPFLRGGDGGRSCMCCCLAGGALGSAPCVSLLSVGCVG